MIDLDSIETVLAALGGTLTERGFAFELAIIGGSSLLLQGFIQRSTRDVDVVAIVVDGELRNAKPLPDDLLTAARDVGRAYGLGDGWLNAGPADVLELDLPIGFLGRCETRRYGGLTVHIAGRRDLIGLKLYAATDVKRVQDLGDLLAMGSTPEELIEIVPWV